MKQTTREILSQETKKIAEFVETVKSAEENSFAARHMGPSLAEEGKMLSFLGKASLEELIAAVIPASILLTEKDFPKLSRQAATSEVIALAELRKIMEKNETRRSFIGLGYYGTIVPAVLQRNLFENPGWYTAYTPYQAEISQGRLEALINFQTMVCELMELDIANASLLDEATSVAEAMGMMFRASRHRGAYRLFVSEEIFSQTLAVLRTRALSLGIEVVLGVAATCLAEMTEANTHEEFFGAILPTQGASGSLLDVSETSRAFHAKGIYVTVTADPLAAMCVRSAGSMGADIACGSTQRFGVPLGYGGPHAAFIAVKDHLKRHLPGRIIGLSVDRSGDRVYRMALQTREQHIRKDKATSNICTAQALLANMAAMYAIYHGVTGLTAIAERVHGHTQTLYRKLNELIKALGEATLFGAVIHTSFFDTLTVALSAKALDALIVATERRKLNLRYGNMTALGSRVAKNVPYEYFVAMSLDETVRARDVEDIFACFREATRSCDVNKDDKLKSREDSARSIMTAAGIPSGLRRLTPGLKHPIFSMIHSETQMLRYLSKLEKKDLSLNTSMIPLGSCTMKLNAVTEMIPLSWEKVANVHPFAPANQVLGYNDLLRSLEMSLAELTGFAKISLQPNSGAQGEYAGLMAIRGYHLKNGDARRKVILIPVSAHGTNPASAVMTGMQPIAVACLENGDIDEKDLSAKCSKHAASLAGLMITYPSTHGVYEERVMAIIEKVHSSGGQVYMDGANMNAQTGWTHPAKIGADVCHLNLHKTFAIPHGGGGPGMGPIGVREHLSEFLPARSDGLFLTATKPGIVFQALTPEKVMMGIMSDDSKGGGNELSTGAVSAAPFGSASILTISYLYIQMLSLKGLKKVTAVAILNANYLKKKLGEAYPSLYTGVGGMVAHEMIIDVRGFMETAGVSAEDIAKRLMDYGFHAPTMSWPVAGTLMIEPTESEDLGELNRFVDALLSIREEIADIETGKMPKENNLLKNAPHTAAMLAKDEWPFPYTRHSAVYPRPWVAEHKYWPPVARIDNVYGDRNLFCVCPPVEGFGET